MSTTIKYHQTKQYWSAKSICVISPDLLQFTMLSSVNRKPQHYKKLSYKTQAPQPVMASSSHRTGGSAHSSVAMMPANAYASAANGSACGQQP